MSAQLKYRDPDSDLEPVTSTQSAMVEGSQRDRERRSTRPRKEADAHATLLQIRGGKMIAVKHSFNLQNTDASLPESHKCSSTLFRRQMMRLIRRREPLRVNVLPRTPKEVLVPQAPDDCEI